MEFLASYLLGLIVSIVVLIVMVGAAYLLEELGYFSIVGRFLEMVWVGVSGVLIVVWVPFLVGQAVLDWFN